MKKFAVLFCLVMASAWGQITWTKVVSNDSQLMSNGYFDIRYDSYTDKTWIYNTNGTNSDAQIYSIQLGYFDSQAGAYTKIGDNGQTSEGGCFTSSPVGTSPTWPFTHHAVGQIWVDTIRHRLWIVEGVGCTHIPPEQWYYSLALDGHTNWVEAETPNMPLHSVWKPLCETYSGSTCTAYYAYTDLLSGAIGPSDTSMSVVNTPANFANEDFVKIDSEVIRIVGNGSTFLGGTNGGANRLSIERGMWGTTPASHAANAQVIDLVGAWNSSAVVHDSDDDVFFAFGNTGSGGPYFMVYCPTVSGTVSSKQTTVGCAKADDWTDLTLVATGGDMQHGSAACPSGAGCLPHGFYYPSPDYDPVHHQIVDYGGGTYGNPMTDTWIYTPSTKAWTKMGPASPPSLGSSNSENIRVAHAFNTSNGLYYYHACMGPSSPYSAARDFVYDPVANTWTNLGNLGGPNYCETMTYDSHKNALIVFGTSTATESYAEIWVGQFSSGSVAPSITSTSPLPQGTVGTPYSYSFGAMGTAPISWTQTVGTLPSGLSLSSGGVLSGTPTATGAYTFAVQVSNSAGTAGPQSFSLTILSQTAAGTAPTITSASTLTAAVQWGAYTYTFAATGTTPITWSATGLPSGLSMNSSGVISGASTWVGTATVAVTASNSAGSATGNFSLTVTPTRSIGHSTYNCVDVDGDGYGVGPGCLGPDADDTDASVHSASDVLTKWGTFAAFWAHMGWNPTGVLYVDGGSGSCTAVSSPFTYSTSTACGTVDAAITAMSAGQAVVVRAGTVNRSSAIALKSGTLIGTSCTAYSYYLAYPGEQPDFEYNSNIDGTSVSGTQSCMIVDGWKLHQACLANASCGGGGYGLRNSGTVYGNTYSHIDVGGFTDNLFPQFNQFNTQIVHNYIHDALPGGDFGHDIYLGSDCPGGLGTPGQGGYIACPGAGSQGTVIAGNIISNGTQTCIHANGPMTNLLIDSNLIYGCGTGFNFQSGISHSTIQNNVIHTTGVAVFQFNTYANSYSSNTWQCHDENYNVVANNTFFMDGQSFNSSLLTSNDAGWPAIEVADDGTCQTQASYTPDLGHNTYANNILVHDCGTNCVDYKGPVIRYLGSNATTYLQTDTYANNLLNNFDTSTSIIDPLGNNSPQNCAWFVSRANVPGASGNICGSNPDFVAANPQWSTTPGSWNLAVSSSSSALAAGLASDAPTYDIMGIARATPPTIGAYEHISVPSSACDLNGDGIVNAVDVQIAINQALGIVPCGSADLQNNGTCNVVDVQRVIVAALGEACLVGP
jgi:hypothetical protein